MDYDCNHLRGHSSSVLVFPDCLREMQDQRSDPFWVATHPPAPGLVVRMVKYNLLVVSASNLALFLRVSTLLNQHKR